MAAAFCEDPRRPQSVVYIPNVTKTLGGPSGWTTPFVVQRAGATSVRVSWYRFADGSLVTTQNLALTASAALRVDPRDVPALSDETRYSVILVGGGQNIAAIGERAWALAAHNDVARARKALREYLTRST